MKNFVAFGNNELETQPEVGIGTMFKCKVCGKRHRFYGGKNSQGEITDSIMFYDCKGKSYLGAVQGKSVVNLL